MNTQLLPIAVVVGTAVVAAGCVTQPVTLVASGDWKCFTIDDTDPSPPHAEVSDKFCVSQRSGAWYLIPGQGMANWKSVGAEKEIPLTTKTDRIRVKAWEFDVEITGHPTPPTGDHGPQHARPDRGYRLQVNIPNTGKANSVIRVAGPSGNPIHGGTAHGVED